MRKRGRRAKPKRDWKEIAVLVVLGILIVVALVQTFELLEIQSAAQGVTAGISQPASSSGVNELPSMVGGC